MCEAYCRWGGGRLGGVHDRLHIYPLCGIFYFPWHRHQIEGTNGFYCIIRKTERFTISNVESQVFTPNNSRLDPGSNPGCPRDKRMSYHWTNCASHITPVLIALHWLPIRYRIIYKILVLTFLAIHNLAPAYITDLISAYEPGRQLRSASRLLLTVPRHNLERFGRRGYSVNAPHLWNDLPDNIRLIDYVALFKGHLKTHLFKAAFSDYL